MILNPYLWSIEKHRTKFYILIELLRKHFYNIHDIDNMVTVNLLYITAINK